MIHYIRGRTRLDKISNEVIRGKLAVAFIEDNIKKVRLRWFRHVRRRSTNAPVRRCENSIAQTIKRVEVDLKRVRGKLFDTI